MHTVTKKAQGYRERERERERGGGGREVKDG